MSSASAPIRLSLDRFSMNWFLIDLRYCRWSHMTAPLTHSDILRATRLSSFFRGHSTPSFIFSFCLLFKKLSEHDALNFNQIVFIIQEVQTAFCDVLWHQPKDATNFQQPFLRQTARWRISMRLCGVFQHHHLRGSKPQWVDGHSGHKAGTVEL